MAAPAPQPYKRVGQYDLYHVIGQGSFASVYRGEHRPTRRVVAIKAIVRARLNRKLQENLEAEISILQSTQHPNVMRLHEVQTTERHVYLVLEYCPGGDLNQVIRKVGAQSEAQTRIYLVQLAHGLHHLRQRNLIHRDLKPQNLLLSAAYPHGTLKIGDFGFARHMPEQDLAETLCGSPLYMAPEILRFHKYDAKADLWSVGAIMYELLTAKPPYNGQNHVQLLKNIEAREPKFPTTVSPPCLKLLTSLLQRDPMMRLCFDDFFQHTFLTTEPPPGASQTASQTHAAPSAVAHQPEPPHETAGAFSVHQAVTEQQHERAPPSPPPQPSTAPLTLDQRHPEQPPSPPPNPPQQHQQPMQLVPPQPPQQQPLPPRPQTVDMSPQHPVHISDVDEAMMNMCLPPAVVPTTSGEGYLSPLPPEGMVTATGPPQAPPPPQQQSPQQQQQQLAPRGMAVSPTLRPMDASPSLNPQDGPFDAVPPLTGSLGSPSLQPGQPALRWLPSPPAAGALLPSPPQSGHLRPSPPPYQQHGQATYSTPPQPPAQAWPVNASQGSHHGGAGGGGSPHSQHTSPPMIGLNPTRPEGVVTPEGVVMPCCALPQAAAAIVPRAPVQGAVPMGASALSAHWAHGQPMLVPPLFQAQTGAQAITAVTTTTAAAMPSPATHHQAGPAGNLLAANNNTNNNAFAPFAMCALPPAVQAMPMLGGGAFHAAVHAAATVTTAFPPSTAPAAVTNPAESAAPKQVVAVSMRGASPGHPSPLPSHCGSQHHAAHGASAAVAGESPTNAESLNGSDSDFVWVGQRAVSPTNQPTMPSELSQQQYAANQQASAEAAAAAAAEAEEAAYLRGLLDLANLLARGGAIADLAALSADGMAHGESLSPVEALALHVKALDLMSNGIKLAEQVAAAASLTPPRLQPAAAEAIAQAEALRARGSGLLRSAEGVRQQIAASSGSVSTTSRRASIVGGPNSGAIVGGGGGDAGGAFLPEEGASVGGASPSASASGGAAAGGGEAAARCGGGSAHMSVCVEEVLYRQALCMGREAAVDELLGHYESSAALYVRAKLTLEQLEHEPMVGEADRAVLSKYGAGFAWRLSSLRSKASMGSLAASPSASAGGGMPATHHPALSEGGQLGLASPDRSLAATAPPS